MVYITRSLCQLECMWHVGERRVPPAEPRMRSNEARRKFPQQAMASSIPFWRGAGPRGWIYILYVQAAEIVLTGIAHGKFSCGPY